MRERGRSAAAGVRIRAVGRGLTLAVYALAACGPAQPAFESVVGQTPPHIVVVLIDTLRADHTSLYGYERDTTPHLQRMASSGAVMRKHYANAPWTKPSVASILTGLHPSAHGSRSGQFGDEPNSASASVEVLSEEHVTFVEILRDAGYTTCAYVSNYNMHADWGYDQGYDLYRQVEAANNANVLRSDRDSIEFAIDALDQARAPTFVWSHLMAVHQYAAPRDWGEFSEAGSTPIDPGARTAQRVLPYSTLEAALAAYDHSILYCDALVGKLFDAIRERHPNTVLIVTSDHGEEFADHGGFEHCWTLYDELMAIPLVLWGPGMPQGTELEGLSDSLDLFPTILQVAGIDLREHRRPGRALVAGGQLAQGKAESFAEQHHRGAFIRYALRRDGRQYIASHNKEFGPDSEPLLGPLVQEELFEGGSDSGAVDQAQTAGEEVLGPLRRKVRRLRTKAEARLEREIGSIERSDLSEEDLERLKELGYDGGG